MVRGDGRRRAVLGWAMLGFWGCGAGPLTAGGSETGTTDETETGADPCASELPGLDSAEVLVEDLDGDGHLDLAGIGRNGESGSGALALAWGHGDGSFTFELGPSFSPTQPMGGGPRLLAGDVDADGDLDLVLYHHTYATSPSDTTATATGRRQTGPRSFGPAQVSVVGQDWTPWQDLSALLRDVDEDGDADLVVGDVLWTEFPGPDSLNNGVAMSDGAGGFGPLIPSGLLVSCFTHDVEAGDFDGDGRDEYVWIGPWTCNGSHDPTPAYVVELDLAGQASIVAELEVGQDPMQAVVADFDGDGALDLVVRNRSDVSRFRGRGDGSFEALPRVAVLTASGAAVEVYRLLAAELDGDPGAELLLVGRDAQVGPSPWLTSRLDEPLAAETPASIVEASVAAVGDFDEDGCDDLLDRVWDGDSLEFRWTLRRCAAACEP